MTQRDAEAIVDDMNNHQAHLANEANNVARDLINEVVLPAGIRPVTIKFSELQTKVWDRVPRTTRGDDTSTLMLADQIIYRAVLRVLPECGVDVTFTANAVRVNRGVDNGTVTLQARSRLRRVRPDALPQDARRWR